MRALETIPNIILGVFIGTLMDRYNRKRLLQLAVGFQMVLIGSLIFLLATEFLQLWQMFMVGFLLSAFGYSVGNAYHTIMPQIVEKDQLTAANATMSLISSLINIIGPGLAGLIIVSLTHHYSLMITEVGLMILLICTFFVQIPHSKAQAEKSFWEDVVEGWRQLVNRVSFTRSPY